MVFSGLAAILATATAILGTTAKKAYDMQQHSRDVRKQRENDAKSAKEASIQQESDTRMNQLESAIQELQAQADLPAEPQVINEVIDELAGVKTVTTRMPDGSQQVRRVRLPLTDEEREQNDAIIAQMNDLIPRMREYIDSGPSDYDPMGAIGQFNALVANFNQK